ncbi:MAG: radical SAM family heme chaperone HemW [Chloroflexi bacterium]|nr:radical SAM family heme chaperone HemW [Chloroflexota bacterium]MCY4246833.1 radical SAM family heme chaperone HemW [Chloroflexota bacterium]
MPESLSIYIHIPFCNTRCGYCAFNTYTDLAQLIPAYARAVCIELAYAASSCPARPVHTIYFGGGTPSLLAPEQFEPIMRQLHDAFALADDIEISLEANPDDLSAGYLSELRALGFNRVSIGMQSANPRILQLFDRQHGRQAVNNAVRSARAAGFDNLNLDVIFGSPGESLADWQQTVAAAVAYAPEHISMYGLELKGGTSLRAQVDAGTLPRPDDDLFADMYEYAADYLAQRGYGQYEISNWRLPAHECRHNLQYWRNLDYIGIGAGAHGFANGARYSTITAPGRYIAALDKAGQDRRTFPLTPAVAKHRAVSAVDDLYETLMMSLRLTREGISRARFQARFGADITDMFAQPCHKLAALGLLRIEAERVRLSDSGRLLSNFVIREFVEAIPQTATSLAAAN